MRKAMSKTVGAGGRFDIFLDSVSIYPLQLAKVFLPLNQCAFFIDFDNCAHGGFRCSSCTAFMLTTLVSTLLCSE